MDARRTNRGATHYMPQLDGLRAIAIIFVLISHWAPQRIARAGPWGVVGVRLFFVLSGFLITGILIRCRQRYDEINGSKMELAARFYARRFLRIFPVYYVTLGVAALLNITPIRESLGWHLSYLTNIYMTVKDKWPGPATPFWSLANEEQFYLLWPWVMLCVPRRALARTMMAAVAIGAASMGITYLLGWDWSCINAQPLAALPSLGVGALLALWRDVKWGSESAKSLFARSCLIVGLIVFMAGGAMRFFYQEQQLKVIGFILGSSGISVWVIDRAARGFGGSAGRLLELPAVLYVGRISYGIYVTHLFIPAILAMFLGAKWDMGDQPMWRTAVDVVVTLVVASASWYLLEKPINNLKRFFPYVPHAARLDIDSGSKPAMN